MFTNHWRFFFFVAQNPKNPEAKLSTHSRKNSLKNPEASKCFTNLFFAHTRAVFRVLTWSDMEQTREIVSRLMKTVEFHTAFNVAWEYEMDMHDGMLLPMLFTMLEEEEVLMAIVRRFQIAPDELLNADWIDVCINDMPLLHVLFATNVSDENLFGLKTVLNCIQIYMSPDTRAKLWRSVDSDGRNPLDQFFATKRTLPCVEHALSTIADLPESSRAPLWVGGDPEQQMIESVMHRVASTQTPAVVNHVLNWMMNTYPLKFVEMVCMVEDIHCDTFLHIAVWNGTSALIQNIVNLITRIKPSVATVLLQSKGMRGFTLASMIITAQGMIEPIAFQLTQYIASLKRGVAAHVWHEHNLDSTTTADIAKSYWGSSPRISALLVA